MKNALVYIHRSAAITAFIMILVFFTSTVLVELFGNQSQIVAVKTYIAYAIWVLIPVMAVTGITGAKMAPKVSAGLIGRKKKRMPFIAANGLMVLVPAALYLKHLATEGQFDNAFYTVQLIELIAGFTNLTLMSLNIRDGLRISAKKREG
ncbi:hypothetical protein L4D09_20310 [Photobacterium makurazakiensis]|uniref:hypothetical protein n=1 Tax=Photobacterium makurazakiensis TaxID=2910234 RepID=UPI003D145AD4